MQSNNFDTLKLLELQLSQDQNERQNAQNLLDEALKSDHGMEILNQLL